MRKQEIAIGATYIAKVSGRRTVVKILRPASWGKGWDALNVRTNREVHIETAGRLSPMPASKAHPSEVESRELSSLVLADLVAYLEKECTDVQETAATV